MGNKTKITRYECCHGFARKNDETECVKGAFRNLAWSRGNIYLFFVVEIKNLVHTLEDIGAAKTGQQIDQNLASKAEDSNFTIFAVTDESLVDYEDYNKKEVEDWIWMIRCWFVYLAEWNLTIEWICSNEGI